MKVRWLLGLAALGAASGAKAQSVAPVSGLVIGRDDFTLLRWIEGSWRGSAEHLPAIYERYRFVDDSTLLVESFGDAKLTQPDATTRYELRSHRLTGTRGDARWLAIALDTFSVEFVPLANTRNSLSWKRQAPNAWIQVLTWPPTADAPAADRLYHMTRLTPKK